VASLQARNPLRSAHPLIVVNKILSLTAFMVLLGAGWIAVCYLKNEINHYVYGPPHETPSRSAALHVGEAAVTPKTSAVPLVYSCVGDKENYHTLAHMPDRCERKALSEQAALQRGLKPCQLCLSR
jgi:hypothetical protein